MNFTYTVIHGDEEETHVYEGIFPVRHLHSPMVHDGHIVERMGHGPPVPNALIVAVQNEDGIDLWWLGNDPKVGLEELRRFYNEQEGWVTSGGTFRYLVLTPYKDLASIRP